MMGKKNKIKYKNDKLKKIMAVWLALFMLISNFALFNIVASAADDTPAVAVSIKIPDSIKAGTAFEAVVTLKNNTSNTIENVTVSTDNTSSGVISLTTSKDVTKNISSKSEATYSFYFNVSGTAGNNIYDINFVISYDNNEKTETRRISITPIPPPVVTDPTPRFSVMSELYPKTATIGTGMKISIRFSNLGGSATNAYITITPPDGVEALSASPKPALIMGTGQSYNADFSYNITSKAKTGLNIFKVTIGCKETGTAISYDIGVTFNKGAEEEKKSDPDISIISADIPENIKKGEKFEIKAVLENTGADAKDIKVSMGFPNGILNFSADVIQIDSLKSGAQTEILFEAYVTDSIVAKYHPFLMHVDYNITDEDGKPKETRKTQYMGLNVTEDAANNFAIDVKIPENVKPGADFKVSVTVKNSGADERNFFLKIDNPAGIINKSANNFLISELKSGKSATYEATFNATEEAAGVYSLFGISLYKKQTGNADIILADRFVGTSVANTELPEIIIDSIIIPQNINMGDTFNAGITVSNIGSADAANVILTVNMPAGILNKTANTVKIDSVKSGGKATASFTFIVTQNAIYGYNPFNLEVSYPTKSNAGGERINQYFGTTLNSSDLKIDSVSVPSSVGVNRDFNAEVTIRNTGADTTNVTLFLTPQGGLINKTSNTVKIESIKAGETVIKSFTFMAPESAQSGYAAIDIVLSHGEEQIRQYSGTYINNPKKEEEQKPDDKTDIPVVIISRFYTNTNISDDNSSANNNNNNNINNNTDTGFFSEEIMPQKDIDRFSNTSVRIAMDTPAIAAPVPEKPGISMPDYGYQGGSSAPVNSAPVDANAVYGGKTFIFTVELLNTHKSVAVKDLKVTISQEHGIFNPKSGSNTFFVEWLAPGQTTEISIPLLVKADAAPDSYGLNVALSYKSESGDPTSASEIINIPVQQEIRFSVGDIPPIYDIEMGDDAYVTVQFGNLGKSKIYNVIARVQGEGFNNYDGAYYAGSIDAGSSFISKEFTLTPYMAGYINGSFQFTYEDADGNIFQEERPFSFNVMGGEDMMEPPSMEWGDGTEIGPDGLPVMNPDGESEESGGFWLFTDMNLMKWAIIIGSGAVIAAGVIVIIVVAVKKSRKKRSDIDDDDL